MSQTIGVLGGLGPHATVDFMKRLYDGPVAAEQDHVRAIVDCNPAIPSRDRMTDDTRRSCGATLRSMARTLEAAGADFIVMPCNTAHVFQAEIEASISCPFLSIVTATADELGCAARGATRIGVLATRTCLDSGLYQSECARRDLETVALPEPELARFMRLIGRIKVGHRGRLERSEMRRLGFVLRAHGAEAIVAACTEIALVAGPSTFGVDTVDSTGALASAALRRARSPREESARTALDGRRNP